MSFTPNIPGHRVYGNINLSGGTITTGSLSASSISASTIFSGNTPITQIFATTGTTFVQPTQLVFGSSSSGLTGSSSLTFDSANGYLSMTSVGIGNSGGNSIFQGLSNSVVLMGATAYKNYFAINESTNALAFQTDSIQRAYFDANEFSIQTPTRSISLSATTLSGQTLTLGNSTYPGLYSNSTLQLNNGTYSVTMFARTNDSNYGNPLGNGAFDLSTNSTVGAVFGTISNAPLVIGTNNLPRLWIQSDGLVRASNVSATTLSSDTIFSKNLYIVDSTVGITSNVNFYQTSGEGYLVSNNSYNIQAPNLLLYGSNYARLYAVNQVILEAPIVRATSFSATTISGGTFYSGNTDLTNIILSLAGSGGEVNTASNVNGGPLGTSPLATVFKQKNLVDLEFRTLSAGTNITLITGDTITIQATGSGSSTLVQPGLNTYTGGTSSAPTVNVSGATLQFFSATSIANIGHSISYSGGSRIVEEASRLYLAPLSSQFDILNSGGSLFMSRFGISGTITTLDSGSPGAGASTQLKIQSGRGPLLLNGENSGDIVIDSGGITATTFTAMTISGGTLYSGATNLSTTIINVAAATGDFTRVQGSNFITTGGTANAPTINLAQNFSGATISGGTLYSGATNLSTTIINVAAATGDFTRVQGSNFITTGGTANAPTINLAQNFSGATVSGGTLYSGATNLSTTIISIANAAASAVDTAVQAGSNIATGGTAAAPTISVVASPSLNALTLSGSGQFAGVTSTGLSATTVSATTLFSGATNLSTTIISIANAAASAVDTAVQAGSNIATGGTAAAPTISLIASPSVTGIIASGTSTLQATTASSFSANTVSGTTYYSGNTTLANAILTLAGSGGEINTASNVNGGPLGTSPFAVWFKQKNGVDLEFRTLSAGTNITLITGDTITIQATGSGSSTLVQPGSNTTTGGTSSAPSVNIVDSPSLNSLTLSGAGQFAGVTSTGLSANTLSGGTLYSGATNLSTTIINVAAATGDFTRVQGSNFITTGGTANAPTINLAQNFSGATVSGGTLYSGATNLSTTIISIANAAASAVDTAVQAGSNIATGGTAAAPTISVVASPSLNGLTLSGAGQFAGVTSTGLSANTLSGGTLYSGATNLYSIFATIGSGGSSTAVQAGSNITTGGTQTAPIISVAASPSLNALTLSGAGQFAEVTSTSLSALTISGGTLYSGSTNLYNIFATSASGEANSGENIGGTSTTVATTAGIFKQKTGVLLEMRMLSAGTNVSFITGDTITIQASGSGSATYVQPGLNTYTGGTSSAPTINISAATLVSLSANTITGTTIWGNGSNLTGVAHAFTGQTSISFSGFSGGETSYATTGVTNSNINSASTVMIRVIPSANHPNVEESMVENLTFTQTDIVDGVSFVINANADGGTWGVYNLVYRIIN